MSTIKLKDGTVLNPININGEKCYVQTNMLYQGMSRDCLIFHFAKLDYNFDQLNTTLGAPEKASNMLICYPETTTVDGKSVVTEAQIGYNDYSILISIGLENIEIAPATVDTATVMEQRWVVKVAQLTRMEKMQADQQKILDDVLISAATV